MQPRGWNVRAVARRVEDEMPETVYEVPAEWKKRAWIDEAKYHAMYRRSIEEPDAFWAEEGETHSLDARLLPKSRTRRSPATMFRSNGSRTAPPTRLTTASTAISPKRGDQVAIIWEGDDPKDFERPSPTGSCTTKCAGSANVLRNRNVGKGDRVTIYLPMISEAAYAILACARIGAIHSVVFGGFSPDLLAARR